MACAVRHANDQARLVAARHRKQADIAPVEGAGECLQAFVQELGRQRWRQLGVDLNVDLRLARAQALLQPPLSASVVRCCQGRLCLDAASCLPRASTPRQLARIQNKAHVCTISCLLVMQQVSGENSVADTVHTRIYKCMPA